MKLFKIKKIVLFCATIVALPLIGSSHVFAAENTTQTTVETVKEAINNLVVAKDEKKQTETPIRIDTLKKAVSLAIEEARDIRTKLINLDELDEQYKAWAKKKEVEIKDVLEDLDLFKKEIAILEKNENTEDAEVKLLAEKIKKWRETDYIPLATEIKEYLLISEEYKSIETAKSRYEKIETDIIKLEKKKRNTTELRKLLEKAKNEIGSSIEINDEAKLIFENTYIPKEKQDMDQKDASESPTQIKSIQDLVKDSFAKVRNSYKIFIEMSNLVRRLLK